MKSTRSLLLSKYGGFDQSVVKMLSNSVNKIWRDSCRRVYVLDSIRDSILECWFWIAEHELSIERKEEPINQVYIKEKINAELGKIRKGLSELYWKGRLSRGKLLGHRTTNISSDQIRTARTYDFNTFLNFNNGNCLCPFHNDTSPSMVYYNDRNVVRCFSCNKTWDTIQFIMDRDGLTFVQAVRFLND